MATGEVISPRESQQAEASPSQQSRGPVGSFIIEAVYVLILLVTVGGWTVIGFVVWLPLLIRTTTLLAAAVFYSTLFSDQARVARAEKSLYFAVRFYLTGFQHFIDFYQQRHSEQPRGIMEPLSEMRWKELVVQCLWVVGAWGIVYVTFHSVLSRLFTT